MRAAVSIAACGVNATSCTPAGSASDVARAAARRARDRDARRTCPAASASDSPVGRSRDDARVAHGHETLARAETDADRREQAIVDRDGDRDRADRAPAVDDRDRAARRERRERADRDAAAADTRRRFTRGDRRQGRAIVRAQRALERRLGGQPPGDGGGQVEPLRVPGDRDAQRRLPAKHRRGGSRCAGRGCRSRRRRRRGAAAPAGRTRRRA